MPKVTLHVLAEDVLDKSMQLFWQKGYFNTSIDDFITHVGFNRAAIYKHFGGKQGLFLAMLKRYRQQVTELFIAPLETPGAGMDVIQAFFSQFMQPKKISQTPAGCFLVATLSDSPSHDAAVVEFVNDFLEQLQKLFYRALETAKRRGEIKKTVDVKTTADFLVGNTLGLMVLLRSSIPKTISHNHIKGTLQFLNTLLTDSA